MGKFALAEFLTDDGNWDRDRLLAIPFMTLMAKLVQSESNFRTQWEEITRFLRNANDSKNCQMNTIAVQTNNNSTTNSTQKKNNNANAANQNNDKNEREKKQEQQQQNQQQQQQHQQNNQNYKGRG